MGLFDQEEELSPVDDVDKNRLFQTLQETTGSSKNYLKKFLVVAVIVLAAGTVIYYLTLPGVGDRVLGPKGLEDAVRSHMLEKQKRNATDITFFYCDNYYWARVNVEKRPDIQVNPIYQIERYRAKAVSQGDRAWDVAALPVTSPELDVPCNY